MLNVSGEALGFRSCATRKNVFVGTDLNVMRRPQTIASLPAMRTSLESSDVAIAWSLGRRLRSRGRAPSAGRSRAAISVRACVRLPVATMIVLVALCMCAGVAGADPFSWSAPIALNTSEGGALACPSSTQCTLVGEKGLEVTFNPTMPGTPTPFTDETDGNLNQDGISCVSTASCTTVNQGLAEITFNPNAPVAVGGAGGDYVDAGSAVSCVSATQCEAVDNGLGSATEFNPIPPNPNFPGTLAPIHVLGTGDMDSIVCLSAGECVAVGDGGLEVTFNPAATTNPTPVLVDPAQPTLSSVSCPSNAQCTAVGENGDVVTFNPADPAAATALSIAPGTDIFQGVACPSTTQCTAVGQTSIGTGDEFTFNPLAARGAGAVLIAGAVILESVACPSVSECVAVDDDGNAFVGTPGCAYGSASDVSSLAFFPHAAVQACPLKVFMKIVGPLAGVGTRSGLSFDDLDPRDGPVNFSIPTVSPIESPLAGPDEAGQKCLSGCANVLVTVIDPKTGKPVQNAIVTATVGTLGAAKSVSHGKGLDGAQLICIQSDGPGAPATCGTSVTGLLTDPDGELHLVYWAPGETAISTSSISVTATRCSSTCNVGEAEGSATTGVTIMPYPIYKHNGGTLSVAEIKSLMTAVGEGKLYKKSHEAASEQAFHGAIHWLAAQDKAAGKLVHAVLGPIGYTVIGAVEVVQILAEAHSASKEEELLTDAMLEAMDIKGIGLYDEPFEKQIPEAPNDYLRQAFIHGLGNADGIGGAGGMMWDLGKALIKQYDSHPAFAVQPEHVKTTIDEISSCNPGGALHRMLLGNAACGYGFFDEVGIQPRLCIILDFSNRLPDGNYGTSDCFSQYDPVAFATTQKTGLDKALPGG